MFTATPSAFGRSHGFANAYARVGVETSVNAASAHKLIELLFNGFMDALATARGAMRAGQIETKGKAIGRAARIVEEGLKAGLNLEGGGRLAADLHALYAYVGLRLLQANLRNDESALDECARLLGPLRDAWVAIGPQVEAGKL
ncbi:MAG: flagellar export chaperone FliS [Burkholderiaceae bacterium]|jgi:flagellar protein FliS|nr:flagellar export chaperone FliS [Burkholderiales bacterium]